MAPQNDSRRAVIYVRISVDRDEQSSTDSQERTARAYAEQRGWSVVACEVDKGRSAFHENTKRPGLEKALKMIEFGAADVLIVWKLDRLIRSAGGFEQIRQRLERAGGSFVSVTDSFDTTTAMGLAMQQIAAVFAQLESGIKSDRIEAWHEQRILAGATPTGPRPYGYRRPNRGQLEIVKCEAAEIHKAATRILDGESFSAICRDLNARKIQTSSTRGTNIWRNRTIRHILTSPTTAGLRDVDGVLREGSWEPILEREQWDRLRTLILDPARRTGTSNARRWLLSGQIVCAKCGSVMRSRNHDQGPRYGCTGARCSISVPIEPTDELVSSAILELLDIDGWNRLRSAQHAPGVDVPALELELEQLADLYGRGEITFPEWQAARKGITSRTANADRQPVELPQVDDLRASWDTLSVDAKLLVVDAVIESVTASPGARGSRGFRPERLSIGWRV